MALFAPQGFKAYDLVIPVGLPKLNMMAYFTVQVKNRKHDSLMAALRTECADLMRTAAKNSARYLSACWNFEVFSQ